MSINLDKLNTDYRPSSLTDIVKIFYSSMLVIFALNIPVYGQDNQEEEYVEQLNGTEIEITMGYGRSNELNTFNNNTAYKPEGGFAINVGVRYYVNYNFSIGLHVKGYSDNIRNYDTFSTMGYSNTSDMTLMNLNFGINTRYTWGNQWQPFVFAGIGYVTGGVLAWEDLKPFNSFDGLAFDLGTGIGLMVSQHTMISLTLAQSFGIAWWEFEPSYTATDNKFNPGYLTFQLGVSFFMD